MNKDALLSDSPRPGVVVVGNALIDRIYRLSNPVTAGSGAWVTGRKELFGGVEANVAAALRRLDVPVGAVTPVGQDADAGLILNDLQSRGIETTHVHEVPGCDTAYCLVLVAPETDRIILGGGTAVRAMCLDSGDLDYIAGWQVCFTSAYVPAAELRKLAGLRLENGGPLLAFDLPDTFDDLETRGFSRTDFDSLLPAVDLLMTNRAGALSYARTDDFSTALALIDQRRCGRAAVSDGERGSWLMDEGPPIHVPAFPVRTTDPTGAGDAYHAALICSWLLKGRPLDEAGSFASAAGALACLGEGARGSLPGRTDIEQMMHTRGK